MKRSKLKSIIKECIRESGEIIYEGYEQNEIQHVLKKHGNSDQRLSMQIRGDGANTKWLSISVDEAKKIAKILKGTE